MKSVKSVNWILFFMFSFLVLISCQDRVLFAAEGAGQETFVAEGTTETGEIVTWTKDGDGNNWITRKDKDGNIISRKPLGAKDKKKGKPIIAQGTNPDNGVTTYIVLNPNGTRNIIREKGGKEISDKQLPMTSKRKAELNPEMADTPGLSPTGPGAINPRDAYLAQGSYSKEEMMEKKEMQQQDKSYQG